MLKLFSISFRLLLLSYLFSKNYRPEIERNFYSLFGKNDPSFWWRNAKKLGENFALMLNQSWQLDKLRFLGDNIKKGEGMIFLTLHFGIWEILPAIFSTLGYPVAIAVSKQRNPFLERILTRIRKATGAKLVSNLWEMVNLLKSGFLLGFAGDNTQRVKRISLPKFWKGFGVIKTPFILARRTKAPLYSLFAHRNGKEVIIFLKRVSSPEEFAQVAREYIKKYPEEWVFWGK
ncbi:MAG: lysophospholipid acyltransferase family protein [candidate division WOR-3 bacterium]